MEFVINCNFSGSKIVLNDPAVTKFVFLKKGQTYLAFFFNVQKKCLMLYLYCLKNIRYLTLTATILLSLNRRN